MKSFFPLIVFSFSISGFANPHVGDLAHYEGVFHWQEELTPAGSYDLYIFRQPIVIDISVIAVDDEGRATSHSRAVVEEYQVTENTGSGIYGFEEEEVRYYMSACEALGGERVVRIIEGQNFDGCMIARTNGMYIIGNVPSGILEQDTYEGSTETGFLRMILKLTHFVWGPR